MDGSPFDDLARRFATTGSRRLFLLGLTGAAGLIGARPAAAACPPGQVERRGIGCVCKTTGRPPVDARCRCPSGQTDVGDGLGCLECRSTGECPPSDACVAYACVDGACARTRTVCDDGDPCTANSCDPAVGCVYPPLLDGQPGECTGGQVWCGGVCTPLGTVTDCTSCGNACSPPDNATAICYGPPCQGNCCDFDCNAGYIWCNHVCKATPPIPDTTLGGRIAWFLDQLNGGYSTMTAEEFHQHAHPGLSLEDASSYFRTRALRGPWHFAGYVGTPTDFVGTFTLVANHWDQADFTLHLDTTAPHRITGYGNTAGHLCF